MKTIKIIDIPKELPYIFRWKDNTYKRDGERYFRVGDNWEPVFYLFQLDEEVELFDLDEEDEFEDIEEILSVDNSPSELVRLADKINSLIINQKKIIERLNKQNI